MEFAVVMWPFLNPTVNTLAWKRYIQENQQSRVRNLIQWFDHDAWAPHKRSQWICFTFPHKWTWVNTCIWFTQPTEQKRFYLGHFYQKRDHCFNGWMLTSANKDKITMSISLKWLTTCSIINGFAKRCVNERKGYTLSPLGNLLGCMRITRGWCNEN